MMTENFNSVLARIDEIRNRFGAAGPVASGKGPIAARSVDPLKPFFPEVLADALKPAVSEGPKGPVRFNELIDFAAARNNVSPAHLKGMVQAESGFRADAVSAAGAMGLTQLMPSTARALGVSDPFDPAQNLDGGAKYLRQQIERFGDVEHALAAYNAGPGAVARHGGIPPYSETRNYVKKVIEYARTYGFEP